MSLPARQWVSSAHRTRVLRALGITPWTRRVATVGPEELAGTGNVAAVADATADGSVCVVVLGQGGSTRELDLLGRTLNACGAVLARAARVTVSAGQLSGVPAAAAYLVFGEAQAHALGRSLPVTVMQRAQIVLVDELALILVDAGAKRRLWGALRRLRRSLLATSG